MIKRKTQSNDKKDNMNLIEEKADNTVEENDTVDPAEINLAEMSEGEEKQNKLTEEIPGGKKEDSNEGLPLPLGDLNSGLSFQHIESAELVLPYDYYHQIHNYLFSDTSREYACQVWCGKAIIGNCLRLYARYLSFPQVSDYLHQSIASLELDNKYDWIIYGECKQLGLSVVDFHSHPFSGNHVGFSGTDNADEVGKFHYFKRHLPESHYASIVMGKSSFDGRIFLSQENSDKPRVLPLKIISREVPIVKPIPKNEGVSAEKRFDRQIRAFGKEGQANLSSMRIGIVGVGGMGATLAIGLVRLGVRKLALIDHDQVEETNLNRLAGMTRIDAKLKPYKVEMVARRLMEIDGEIDIDCFTSDVFEPAAWQKLRGVDLIIASTDNHSSRMLLNTIAHQYLVPVISVGTLIDTENGKFKGAYGHVYSILPGQAEPCLLCSDTINKREAYYELGPNENRQEALTRGYIKDFNIPDPSVYHLNGLLGNLALIEIHNLACGFMDRRVEIQYDMEKRQILSVENSAKCCAVCSPSGGIFGMGDLIDPITTLFPFKNAK
ncbi:MAG: ThiF family adenylyltransferase [Candidatus Aminicenantes bacterium]|nr:ThiF family adenylyltransferase [Candidatus Aminicenantes bacterium]